MKRAEKEADLYRNLLMLALTSLLGIIAFWFANVEKLPFEKNILLAVAMLLVAVWVAVSWRLVNKNLKELEEIKND